jgi:hypothetical protein
VRRPPRCPCGSGLRPDGCCGRAALARRLGLRVIAGGGLPRPVGVARPSWNAVRGPRDRLGLRAIELDLLDLWGEEGPRAAVCAVAGPDVLDFSFLRRLPADASAGLVVLEAAFLRVADLRGAMPQEARMRDERLAAMLAERLARWGVRCRADLPLYGVASLLAQLAASRVRARSLGAAPGA